MLLLFLLSTASGIWGTTGRPGDDRSNGGVSVSSRQGTQGSEGGAAAAAGRGSSNGTQPAGRHSHTPSFTTLMDASGFNLIEDYAQPAAAAPELAEEVLQQQQQKQGSGRKGKATSRSPSPSKPQRQLSSPAGAAAAAGGGADGLASSAPRSSSIAESFGGARKPSAISLNEADGLEGGGEFRVGAKRQQGTGSKSVGGWTPTPSIDNLSALDASLEEEADEVDAEVYEHERVQPFR